MDQSDDGILMSPTGVLLVHIINRTLSFLDEHGASASFGRGATIMTLSALLLLSHAALPLVAENASNLSADSVGIAVY